MTNELEKEVAEGEMNLNEKIAELEALDKARTQGEWVTSESHGNIGRNTVVDSEGKVVAYACCKLPKFRDSLEALAWRKTYTKQLEADAAVIAAVPTMMRVIRELWEMVRTEYKPDYIASRSVLREQIKRNSELKAKCDEQAKDNKRLRDFLTLALPYIKDGQLADAGAALHASNMGLESHSKHKRNAAFGLILLKDIKQTLTQLQARDK